MQGSDLVFVMSHEDCFEIIREEDPQSSVTERDGGRSIGVRELLSAIINFGYLTSFSQSSSSR